MDDLETAHAQVFQAGRGRQEPEHPAPGQDAQDENKRNHDPGYKRATLQKP